jgi:tetratricopeptide (TPR) repeat protein
MRLWTATRWSTTGILQVKAEYKKALEIEPNDATAHQWLTEDIGYIGGREQEAIAEIDRAHQFDPASAIITWNRDAFVSLRGSTTMPLPSARVGRAARLGKCKEQTWRFEANT